MKHLISAAVIRMNESLSLLQESDVDFDKNIKNNTLKFYFNHGSTKTTLQMIIIPNQLIVMLFDAKEK